MGSANHTDVSQVSLTASQHCLERIEELHEGQATWSGAVTKRRASTDQKVESLRRHSTATMDYLNASSDDRIEADEKSRRSAHLDQLVASQRGGTRWTRR